MEVDETEAVYTDLDSGTIKALESKVDRRNENNRPIIGKNSENFENSKNISIPIQNPEIFSEYEGVDSEGCMVNKKVVGDSAISVENNIELLIENVAKEVVVSKKKKNGYTCLICSRRFSQNAGRYNHMRNVHNIHPGEKTNVRCLEKNCSFTCSYKEKLQLHLSEFHGIDMVITMKSFDSVNDFLRWKDEFERQEKSRFVKKSGSRVREEGIRVAYYYCSRSGTFVSHSTGIKNSKKKGTSKTNHHCTASITCVEMPDGKVEVKICSTHYGHETDLQHLRLTLTEKYKIAEQLCKGVPRDLILDNVRSSAGPEVDRIHLITIKDVKNIEKAFGIQAASKEKTSNMFYNLTVWISSIMKSEHCPVLYFKEDGVLNNKNHCVTLILLTTGQQEVLNRYGSNGIYYVTSSVSVNKQPLTNHPRLSIHLTSLILIDDLNEAVPVSFMISNKGDTDKYMLFFQSLKRQVPRISAKVVITDDKKEIYEVWRDVFEEEPHHLWSNRFVDSEWRENLISIPDEELQVSIYETLYSYLESQDQAKLESSLENYIYELQNNEVTNNFGSYFASRFIGTEILWAGCYGKKIVSVSAQINMENLYNEIQESGQKRHWDRNFIVRIVQNLLKLVSDKQCVRQTKLQRQIQEITTHHDLALNIKPETILAESDSCWRIDSVKDPVNIYSKVAKVKESCDPNSCMLYCSKCNVCVHQFNCTCRVHAYDRTMCKHIHAVALRFFPQMEEMMIESYSDLACVESTDTTLNESSSGTEEKPTNSELESLLTDDLVPIATSARVWKSKNRNRKPRESTNETNLLPVLEELIKNKRPVKTCHSEERKRGRPRKTNKQQEVSDENKLKSSKEKVRNRRANISSENVTKANEDNSSSGRLRPHRINILRKFKNK
uniref:SWIM-type domain-containing protein n=1 Tax=Graphocephala atropunctata TaxID=36148 RepID=A0A1B6LVA4_9HEMI